jgi:hypothetical protein
LYLTPCIQFYRTTETFQVTVLTVIGEDVGFNNLIVIRPELGIKALQIKFALPRVSCGEAWTVPICVAPARLKERSTVVLAAMAPKLRRAVVFRILWRGIAFWAWSMRMWSSRMA